MNATVNGAARGAIRAALVLSVCVATGSGWAEYAVDPPPWVEQARAAATQLAGQLLPALQQALRDGGPANAVEVCSRQAQTIARAVSTPRLQIGRTALRVRNPANAADAWEHAVLEDFERQFRDGAEIATLEAWTVVQREGRSIGRWIKAIPTAPICTTCHGSAIEPELAKVIRARYPDDRATGFRAGDLRGAFTATVELAH